jgi:hypothetical protein
MTPVARHVRAKRSRLTANDLRRALDFLGVPVQRLARHVGCRDTTAASWVNGHSPIPGYIQWVLLCYWIDLRSRRFRGLAPLPLPLQEAIKSPSRRRVRVRAPGPEPLHVPSRHDLEEQVGLLPPNGR